MAFAFSLTALCPDTQARTGVLETPHGAVPTPVFMPVGTQGSVKAVPPSALQALGAGIVLGNAYHLYLRPGHQRIARLGGLPRFTGWNGPMLTDSGGFQVFSLAKMRRVTEEGVHFRSHIDGSEHFLSPEIVIEIEEALAADIAMVLDEPAPYPSAPEDVAQATERTHRWAARSLEAHRKTDQALFAIIQGGVDPALRRRSARTLVAMAFPGYAIGGLSLGEPKDEMWRMVDVVTSELPHAKPRYLMGVGSPVDVLNGIARGVDMFDCSFPTRIARNGALLVPEGRVNITNARFAEAAGPVLEGCDCTTCIGFSAAYLHHLFNSRELLAYQLASVHNLRFLVRLVEQARAAITGGTFADFQRSFIVRFQDTDPDVRSSQKAKWKAARDRAQGIDGAAANPDGSAATVS